MGSFDLFEGSVCLLSCKWMWCCHIRVCLWPIIGTCDKNLPFISFKVDVNLLGL